MHLVGFVSCLKFKQHGKSFYTPKKPFPLYPCLEKFFEKDRANGTYAEMGDDMNEQVDYENEQEFNENLGEGFDSLPTPIQSQSGQASTSEKLKIKRPKITPDVVIMDRLAESFKYATDQKCKSLEALGVALTRPREEAGAALATTGFNNQEVVQGAMKLSENPLMMKTFWTLTDEQKGDFVRSLLNK